jgi:hypothetical protein
VWTGPVAKAGYPITRTHKLDGTWGVRASARRFAWHLLVDETEIGGVLKCKKNNLCVNPEHLGLNHSKVSTVTEERVEEIRSSLAYFFKNHRKPRRVSLY